MVDAELEVVITRAIDVKVSKVEVGIPSSKRMCPPFAAAFRQQ